MPKTTLVGNGAPISNANPLPVQQAQLTDANDELRANQYVLSGGVWVPRTYPNASAPHQNLTLASNATSNIVTSTQGGGGIFRIHELLLFSTVAAVLSLFDGTPSGTTNLLARLGVAANSVIVKDFKGLVQVSAGNHLVIRNDGASTIAITAQTDIEVMS